MGASSTTSTTPAIALSPSEMAASEDIALAKAPLAEGKLFSDAEVVRRGPPSIFSVVEEQLSAAVSNSELFQDDDFKLNLGPLLER